MFLFLNSSNFLKKKQTLKYCVLFIPGFRWMKLHLSLVLVWSYFFFGGCLGLVRSWIDGSDPPCVGGVLFLFGLLNLLRLAARFRLQRGVPFEQWPLCVSVAKVPTGGKVIRHRQFVLPYLLPVSEADWVRSCSLRINATLWTALRKMFDSQSLV